MQEQTHNFYVQDGWLEESFAKELKDKYDNKHYANWKARMCGRFIAFLDPADAERYLETLYYTESSPFYKNNKMIRNAHIFLIGMAPDSILPSHREKSYGGCSYYLSDLDEGDGSELSWFENEDELKQYEFDYDKRVTDNYVIPAFNRAAYWKTDNLATPIFNKWHRISKNASDKFRVSIQMFWDDTRMTTVHREYNESGNYTSSTMSGGSLEIYHVDYAMEYHNAWQEKHASLLDELGKAS